MDDSEQVKSLVAQSRTAMERAYAPYSGFKVGAAVLGGSGKVYTGCNVENVSFGLTVCAERTAILKAVSEGEREIRAVAISNSSAGAVSPCGACRQVMVEFAPSDHQLQIYLASDGGVETYTLADLLPRAFKP